MRWGCQRMPTPSIQDKDCREFMRKNRKLYPKEPGQLISLSLPEGEKFCYPVKPGEHGWCQGINTDNDFSDNWGWCKGHCRYKDGSHEKEANILAKALQETQLNILPMSHCKNHVTRKRTDNFFFMGKYVGKM